MWSQLGVLIISAIGQIAATGVLALTPAGKRTPSLLYAALVRIGNSLAKLIVHCFPCFVTYWVAFLASRRPRVFGVSDGHQSALENQLTSGRTNCCHDLCGIDTFCDDSSTATCFDDDFARKCQLPPQVLNAIFAFSWSVHFNKLSHGVASPGSSGIALKTPSKLRFPHWVQSGKSAVLEEGRRVARKPDSGRSTGGCLAVAASRVVPVDGDPA